MKTKKIVLALMMLCSALIVCQMTSCKKKTATAEEPDPTPSSINLGGTRWGYSHDLWLGSTQHYVTTEEIRFINESIAHIEFRQVTTIYDGWGGDPEININEDSGDCEYSCNSTGGTLCGNDFTYTSSSLSYRGHTYYKK